MSATDDLVRNAARHAASFEGHDLPAEPARKVAVLACMDARVNPYAILGLQEGDAHVIRNAGGVVTEDEIRSLAISQRLLGTEEVIVMHHTDCGLLKVPDDEFRRAMREDTGVEPGWDPVAVADLDENVRRSVARIAESPFIPHTESVRGFVYDVESGALREVS